MPPTEGLCLMLLENAEAIYTPERLTNKHILIAGGIVAGILSDDEKMALDNVLSPEYRFDCSGCFVTPGFVDMHEHILGGGGEAGPASRCPPAELSQLLDAGVTTVVGVLGTDDVSRSQEELVVKARGLRACGLSAYTWIGSYHVPITTCTGSITKDMLLLDTAVGVGEVAVSDHRGSQIGCKDLAQIAAQARVGGMLSGKAGLLYMHMGDGAQGLAPVLNAFESSDVPIEQFLPTHVERTDKLIDQGEAWIAMGGCVDVTVGDFDRARAALTSFMAAGLPFHLITVSSDAFGSWPVFDHEGKLLSYKMTKPSVLLDFIHRMHTDAGWRMETILPLITSNAATRLKLNRKGHIATGSDADILVFSTDLELQYVFAMGKLVRTPEWVSGGMFERGARIRPVSPT